MFLDRGLDSAEDSKIYSACAPTAPRTHIFVYFDNEQDSSGVSFWLWDFWWIWKWNQNSVNTTEENAVVLKSKALLPTPLLSSVYGQYDPFHLKTEILRRLWNPRSPDSESRAKGRLNHNWGLLKCSLLSGSLQSWQYHLLPKTPHSCRTRGCTNTRRKAQGGCTPA